MIEHHLVRAAVIPDIVVRIAKHYGVSEAEALERFYLSTTGKLYADDLSGYYGQSALYIAEMFIREEEARHGVHRSKL